MNLFLCTDIQKLFFSFVLSPFFTTEAMTTNTPFTEEEIKLISEKLQRSLGPEFLTQRPGPSGRLTYIEGKTAINLANEIFGFNGWTSEIKDTTVDFVNNYF